MNEVRDRRTMVRVTAAMVEWTMETDGFGKLCKHLDGLSGGSFTLPFERIREVTGQALPDVANSEAW